MCSTENVAASTLADEGDKRYSGETGRLVVGRKGFWGAVADMFFFVCVGGGKLLCVGSVTVLLFQTNADRTARQTFGWVECLSLSSQLGATERSSRVEEKTGL